VGARLCLPYCSLRSYSKLLAWHLDLDGYGTSQESKVSSRVTGFSFMLVVLNYKKWEKKGGKRENEKRREKRRGGKGEGKGGVYDSVVHHLHHWSEGAAASRRLAVSDTGYSITPEDDQTYLV
jgi:hypothetical protein